MISKLGLNRRHLVLGNTSLAASSAGHRRAVCYARAGLAAIYTDHVTMAHVIRKVILRQSAILNYVNPF